MKFKVHRVAHSKKELIDEHYPMVKLNWWSSWQYIIKTVNHTFDTRSKPPKAHDDLQNAVDLCREFNRIHEPDTLSYYSYTVDMIDE